VLPPLRGEDEFHQGHRHVGNVEEFWSFAISDLRMNNVRGWLAEYLVHKALGITPLPPRVEWELYDVVWRRGDTQINIEVKSSGYLQAWAQKQLSTLNFTGLKRVPIQDGEAQTSFTPEYKADVYVFCAQTAITHEEYDPLDLSQWHFLVLGHDQLETAGLKSMTWNTALGIAGHETDFMGLADDVVRVFRPSAVQHLAR
jgi:hypothetical protein